MPHIPDIDRVRLTEAFHLADKLQDSVRKGWHKAPFAVLLVTPDYEFLVRHPHPSNDFLSAGYDRLLHSLVYYRKRQFAINLLATFLAVNGISTIVVGQAENTDAKTSTTWVVTLLHEHFHQWQDLQLHIYDDIAALDLAHGDTTGMWMLNYAFPYAKLARALPERQTSPRRLLRGSPTSLIVSNLRPPARRLIDKPDKSDTIRACRSISPLCHV